jgi:hypothetical protein
MLEGFNTFSSTVSDTAAMSDVELQRFFGILGSNSAAFSQLQATNTIDAIVSEKADAFTSARTRLVNSDNNVGTAISYIGRTQDLTNLAMDVKSMNSNQISTLSMNKDVSVRQHEINEWANSNKLDTLYFLQLLFVSLSFIAALLFFKVSGLVSGALFTMLTITIGIIVVIVSILRYRYSYSLRDSRYWNKTRFPKTP